MLYALTIAGSDPTGGAGLQADLAVFQSLGLHGLSVPVALTAQNTVSVRGAIGVDAEFITLALKSLLEDIRPGALKTGMLFDATAVRAVCEAMDAFKLVNLVVDPVCVSSSGYRLLDDDGLDIMKRELFRRARVVTPNIPEAELLTGMRIRSTGDMADAARAVLAMGVSAAVIKGGHAEGEPVDIYCDAGGVRHLTGMRRDGQFHGTGCAYSAALAAYLCMGQSPYDASAQAKKFVTAAIERAYRPGAGAGILGIRNV